MTVQERRMSLLKFLYKNNQLIVEAIREKESGFKRGTKKRALCDLAIWEVPYSTKSTKLDVWDSVIGMYYDASDKIVYWSEKEQKIKKSNKKREELFKARSEIKLAKKYTPKERKEMSKMLEGLI